MDTWPNFQSLGVSEQSVDGVFDSLIIKGYKLICSIKSFMKDSDNTNVSMSASILPLFDPIVETTEINALIAHNYKSCFTLNPWWAAKANSSVSFDESQVCAFIKETSFLHFLLVPSIICM